MYDVDNFGSSLDEDKFVSDYDKAKIKELENSTHKKNKNKTVRTLWIYLIMKIKF